MADQVTLLADIAGMAAPLESGMRPARRDDIDELGCLYFESYDPGVASDTLEEANEDIRASFDGEYGELVDAATLVATDASSLVGAVMTVRRPPWDGLPDCPMIIELFVDRDHRRRGLGRNLLVAALGGLAASGESRISLRVDPGNEPAMALYRSLGFREWSRT